MRTRKTKKVDKLKRTRDKSRGDFTLHHIKNWNPNDTH